MNSIFLDVGTLNVSPTLFPQPTFVYCAKYHPGQANLVLTSCYDKVIRVWNNIYIYIYIYIYVCIYILESISHMKVKVWKRMYSNFGIVLTETHF